MFSRSLRHSNVARLQESCFSEVGNESCGVCKALLPGEPVQLHVMKQNKPAVFNSSGSTSLQNMESLYSSVNIFFSSVDFV